MSFSSCHPVTSANWQVMVRFFIQRVLFCLHVFVCVFALEPTSAAAWRQSGLRPLRPLFTARPLPPFDIWEGRRGANSLVA